jgi:hypothetical protein
MLFSFSYFYLDSSSLLDYAFILSSYIYSLLLLFNLLVLFYSIYVSPDVENDSTEGLGIYENYLTYLGLNKEELDMMLLSS